MKLVGLIGSHCALTQLWLGRSRTGSESIRRGWDHARGQGNQLVRGAQPAIFSFRFSFFFYAGDLWLLLNEEGVPTTVPVIMDRRYSARYCWSPAPPTLTLSRANAGPWRSFLQEMVRACGATLVSRLLLHTGQELILRGSSKASSLEHLQIRENIGKGDICHSTSWLCSIFFFAFYFIRPKGNASQPNQIVSFPV